MDFPWNDRRGRFSGLRLAACLLATAPALWVGYQAVFNDLGPRPFEVATHETGLWTLRLLLVTLALTPLRRITGWTRLAGIRRLLGLTVFAYAAFHLTLYIGDQGWNVGQAASEIVNRIYLTIGFIAVFGLMLLAATSNDAAIRRMKLRWHHLHRIVYGLAALGILHFFMQSKLEATEAALMMGFWLLLMGYRVAHGFGAPLNTSQAGTLTLAAIALLAALATAGLEATWYGVATGIPWRAVLNANLTLAPIPRPALITLAVGLSVAILPLLSQFLVTSIRSGGGTEKAKPPPMS
ncbi:sulfoxide reductase heme-binding subunit YedZ [Hwanghaeella grinnelliae]|uniref:Protein-methionine-sulfoxide reductase heme-binding subunit MsrQ n=1 Tax=Hwanghaeella grinnelliae TaxID=2500179 RepID=A0A3S2WSU7_9PROT|nr:sulfoxide reductase heme-binding subunit YedZ [Hwanghaeella grinnelliae]